MDDPTDGWLVIGVFIFLALLGISTCILYVKARCNRNQDALLDWFASLSSFWIISNFLIDCSNEWLNKKFDDALINKGVISFISVSAFRIRLYLAMFINFS